MAWKATTDLATEAQAALAWSLSIRGETAAFRPAYLNHGFDCMLRATEQQMIDAVADVARRRREYLNKKCFVSKDKVFLENVLICNPFNSIQTSLAADWTDGFFDSSDLAPSGFWIGYITNDDKEKEKQYGGMFVAYFSPKFHDIVEEAAPTWLEGFACWGTEIEMLSLPNEETEELKMLLRAAFC